MDSKLALDKHSLHCSTVSRVDGLQHHCQAVPFNSGISKQNHSGHSGRLPPHLSAISVYWLSGGKSIHKAIALSQANSKV